MDRPLDPVNRSAWEKNLDRVHKLQQSAPGKSRKFAQALNEELEEEEKRQQADDAVILSDDATAEQDEHDEHEAETEEEHIEAGDGRPVTKAPEDTDEQDEAPPHIDVTA